MLAHGHLEWCYLLQTLSFIVYCLSLYWDCVAVISIPIWVCSVFNAPFVFNRLNHVVLYEALRWRHNDHDSVSNHQPLGCLLNRLFRRRSKKTSKLRVTGLCVGNSPGPVNSPHKGPVTRKMFPFDDVIMGVVCTCILTVFYVLLIIHVLSELTK